MAENTARSPMTLPKLIIQVPCFNEEEHLATTLHDLPRKIAGVGEVEILVIDDGSSDRTGEVARLNGADHVLRIPNNRGLARAFRAGLDAALQLGADVIVNTDGDNQYCGSDIEKLIQPILSRAADMVIGDRDPGNLSHFSPSKQILQRYGSWVVRTLSGTQIPDTTSGFRAFSRDAAMRLNVLSDFTYTLETIIQAGKKKLPITHVPVTANPERRDSKLFNSTWSYVKRSASTMLRIYTMYEPLKVFSYIGGLLIAAGMALGVRFLVYYFTEGGGGHIQSLLLTVLLIIVGFQTVLIGMVADLIGANRMLLEDVLFRLRRLELEDQTTPVEGVFRGPKRRARGQGEPS